MSEAIQLSECESWQGNLAAEDVEFVLNVLSEKFDYRREIRGRETIDIINPKQWVGVIVLPSGKRLESRPKVPVRNLFYMLAVALGLKFKNITFWDELAEYEHLDELLEFVASYFTDLLDDRVRRGLYRSYIDQKENLHFVRGRIDFMQDLRLNHALRHRHYCGYSEFTWDIPENQVLRQVTHLLSGWGFSRRLKLRLVKIDSALAEITPTQFTSNILDRFNYTRHNADYKHLHQFCRLFLDGFSLHEDVGSFYFQTFLLDMNKLFEKFVTKLLISEAPDGVLVSFQVPMHLDVQGKVRMAPDLVITTSGVPQIIGDCKYKRLESGQYKNFDLYQIALYCVVGNVSRGILAYPQSESDETDELHIRNTSIVVNQMTIDLSKEGDSFRKECKDFSAAVFSHL
ncbi:MAG: hypothetical protein H0V18_16215 [Pyrinomonadaceae bacterium]|nr:hypothetical protein [Pyrinomonadaceae bacterium]